MSLFQPAMERKYACVEGREWRDGSGGRKIERGRRGKEIERAKAERKSGERIGREPFQHSRKLIHKRAGRVVSHARDQAGDASVKPVLPRIEGVIRTVASSSGTSPSGYLQESASHFSHKLRTLKSGRLDFLFSYFVKLQEAKANLCSV